MAETSKIEWTDATWNPITGCTLVSEGCRNCYAATLAATRLQHHPSRAGLARLNAAGEAKFTGEVRFNEQWLDQPLRWKRPKRIFVCAHGDLFHEAVPDVWIDRVFAVMALAPQHTFQVLTKRPERMRAYLTAIANDPDRETQAARAVADLGRPLPEALAAAARIGNGPLPNVWLGVSVEDQATAGARVPILLTTPAVKLFVSAEPLLGPLDFTRLSRLKGGGEHETRNAISGHWQVADGDHFRCGTSSKLDWVIVGGESGPGARPMHPDWARSLRDQCAAAGVPFFFKQWGRYVEADTGVAGGEDVFRDTDPHHISAYRGGVGFGRLTFMARNGHFVEDSTEMTPGRPYRLIESLGKTAAGRLLDGATHDGWP